MRILIGSAHPYLPQLIGGAQCCTHELAMALLERGHAVCVVAGLSGKGWFGFRRRLEMKLRGRRQVDDHDLGYPVFRTWFPPEIVADVARRFRADVVMLQSGSPVEMARAVAGTGIPTVIYLHNVEPDDLGGSISELAGVTFIANSRFTAQRFASSDGVSAPVIYPMIAADRYRTRSSRRNVTFVNPHVFKGVDIAVQVAAACPDIPFTFVRAWTLSAGEEAALKARVGALANVTVRPPTMDMRSVYGEAKLVLAPSRWEEAFGRVAAEAQLSGIPVIGSDRGGLREAIGPGGCIVPIDAPIEDWVAAIRSLWFDEARYAAMCEAALEHSRRPEMNPERQVDRILEVLTAARAGEPPSGAGFGVESAGSGRLRSY